jgi:hypothetical protein
VFLLGEVALAIDDTASAVPWLRRRRDDGNAGVSAARRAKQAPEGRARTFAAHVRTWPRIRCWIGRRPDVHTRTFVARARTFASWIKSIQATQRRGRRRQIG